MKTLLSILLFVSFAITAKAQTPIIDSTRFISGIKGGTGIKYAIPTNDRGIFFVGSGGGNCGGIIPPFLLDTVLDNVLIGKIDSNQHISWLKIYGGTQADEAVSACQTPDGGYAVLAETASPNGDVTGFKGGLDIWLLRIDSVGNLLWEKTYGSPAGDEPISIANTPDHGFILLGSSNGAGDDIPIHYGGEFNQNWAVFKIDSIGTLQWCKTIGGSNGEGGGTILSANGGYYLAGYSGSTDYDCTDSAWHNGVNTGSDYYLFRLDTAGNILWDSSYGGTGNDYANFAIYDARDSSIVITGSGGSNDYIETDQHGEGDMLTIKVDKNGVVKWHKSIGGVSFDNGMCIITNGDNGYVLLGNTFPYPDITPGDIGLEDNWLLVLDSNGNTITNKIFGGIDDDMPFSVMPYKNGFVATGISSSTFFTEGSNYGRFNNNSVSFISYIDNWNLATPTINQNEKFVCYPNPCNGVLKINIPSNENGKLYILNTIGQVVFTKEVNNIVTPLYINTNSFNKGMYIVFWQKSIGNTEINKLILN